MACGRNGKVYVFGGWETFFAYKNETLEYDIESQTWTILDIDEKPTHRKQTSMIYIDDNTLLLFGGDGVDEEAEKITTLNDTWFFDTETNTWTEYTTEGNIPTRRFDHGMAYISNGKALLYGGASGDGDTYDDYEDIIENFDFMWEFTLPDEWGAVEALTTDRISIQ